MIKDPDIVWNNCLTIIKKDINPQSYKTWFEPVKAVKFKDNILSIQVPNKFFYEWLEEHYIKILKLALTKELGKDVKTGKFGADMQVELINDGPVTIIMDSKAKK